MWSWSFLCGATHMFLAVLSQENSVKVFDENFDYANGKRKLLTMVQERTWTDFDGKELHHIFLETVMEIANHGRVIRCLIFLSGLKLKLEEKIKLLKKCIKLLTIYKSLYKCVREFNKPQLF